MRVKIYAIMDDKAAAFMEPFFAQTNGLAIRRFSSNTNNPDSIFNKFPDDFQLFKIGEFDDHTGRITGTEKREALGYAREYLEADNQIKAVS